MQIGTGAKRAPGAAALKKEPVRSSPQRLCLSIIVFNGLHYRLAHILVSTGTKSGPFPHTAALCSTLCNMPSLCNCAPPARRPNLARPPPAPSRSNYTVINVIQSVLKIRCVSVHVCVCMRAQPGGRLWVSTCMIQSNEPGNLRGDRSSFLIRWDKPICNAANRWWKPLPLLHTRAHMHTHTLFSVNIGHKLI